jgi:hypothetical protein
MATSRRRKPSNTPPTPMRALSTSGAIGIDVSFV